MTPEKVAIVGFAPSYVDTPFADSSFEIWTMNYHHEDVPRSDAIFELHEWDVVRGEDGGTHVESLRRVTCPVWMLEVRPEVPTSRAYPIEEMEKYRLPNSDKPYFTNTASYMIALAIERRFKEIHLFGIDMAHDTEYGSQRPSCEFFLGVAFGLGITVVPHRTSDLLKTGFLYGFESQQRDWMREKLLARRKHLEKMKAFHEEQLRQHQAAVCEFNGALQNNDHITKVWT